MRNKTASSLINRFIFGGFDLLERGGGGGGGYTIIDPPPPPTHTQVNLPDIHNVILKFYHEYIHVFIHASITMVSKFTT